MIVSYLRDQTSAESSALRCQVAGLLKDVPYHALPMCKFRELFQSRFKTSISVLDLYRMPDICSISIDANDEKFISLQPELVNSNENNSLIESNQHSAPYCIYHFKADTNKGWAEIEIDPLPNVFMSLTDVQSKIFPLLKSHPDDIPIASLLYCIESELGIKIIPNDRGVSLEHLVNCVQGIQIKNNNYGIKVLAWLEDKDNADGEYHIFTNFC
jgi:meiosis arrest female protein 1